LSDPAGAARRKQFMRRIATEIARRSQAAGHEAYFVGGCVRDQMLGQEPHDYDIATSATPEQIESLFPRQPGTILGALLPECAELWTSSC